MPHVLASCLVALVLAGASNVHAQSAAQPDNSRGELLYATHCIACHSNQVHWRERRLARDWPSLLREVQRWQGNAGLRWSPEDVAEVARYLNGKHYKFAQPGA